MCFHNCVHIRMIIATVMEVFNNLFIQKGRSPLHVAIEKSQIEIVKILVTHGASVNRDTEHWGIGTCNRAYTQCLF